MLNPVPIATFLMIVLLASSNYLVQFPINIWLTWGSFIFPITFLVTEIMSRFYGPATAKRVVYYGFIATIILSFACFDKRIAAASSSSFLIGQLLDIVVFMRVRSRTWWLAPTLASAIASLTDVIIFFVVAFYGTQVPWITLAIGDFAVKSLMNFILLFPFWMMTWKSGNERLVTNLLGRA